MREKFKPLKGFEKQYEVSSFGRIKSLERPWVKQDFFLTPSITQNGYAVVSLWDNGRFKPMNYIHRLVAEHFMSNEDNKPCINHKDGNKQNNHLYNLEWCTYSDNMKHAYCIGLRKLKLTIDQISEIRMRYASGEESFYTLSKDYPVSKSTIRRIVHKKYYWENKPKMQ